MENEEEAEADEGEEPASTAGASADTATGGAGADGAVAAKKKVRVCSVVYSYFFNSYCLVDVPYMHLSWCKDLSGLLSFMQQIFYHCTSPITLIDYIRHFFSQKNKKKKKSATAKAAAAGPYLGYLPPGRHGRGAIAGS